MNASIHRKDVPRANPFPIPLVGRFDRFALYATTTAVLFFAVYPFLFFGERSSLWFFGVGRRITLNDFLTIMLSLEAFLLFWLWREMPRRHKAESSLKKINSVQRAISQASGRTFYGLRLFRCGARKICHNRVSPTGCFWSETGSNRLR